MVEQKVIFVLEYRGMVRAAFRFASSLDDIRG